MIIESSGNKKDLSIKDSHDHSQPPTNNALGNERGIQFPVAVPVPVLELRTLMVKSASIDSTLENDAIPVHAKQIDLPVPRSILNRHYR